jgi:hypothetical protein
MRWAPIDGTHLLENLKDKAHHSLDMLDSNQYIFDVSLYICSAANRREKLWPSVIESDMIRERKFALLAGC